MWLTSAPVPPGSPTAPSGGNTVGEYEVGAMVEGAVDKLDAEAGGEAARWGRDADRVCPAATDMKSVRWLARSRGCRCSMGGQSMAVWLGSGTGSSSPRTWGLRTTASSSRVPFAGNGNMHEVGSVACGGL